jgi:hypothetical protein
MLTHPDDGVHGLAAGVVVRSCWYRPAHRCAVDDQRHAGLDQLAVLIRR